MQMEYDCYGIGNALVDMEIQVPESFLQKHNIQKGVTELVNEEKLKKLLSCLDLDQLKEKRSGGSAANSMLALAQFGGRSYYACKVADDELGKFFHDDLIREGVYSNHNHFGQGTTGKCLVFITEDAERSMYTYLKIEIPLY